MAKITSMMTTAVLSVAYPLAKPFLRDFFGSLAAQDDQDFELLLINDGVADLEKLIADFSLKVNVITESGTPAFLRKTLLSWAFSKGYKELIFADSDDYFSPDRVRVSKDQLRSCPLVFNELELVYSQGERLRMLGSRMEDGAKISRFDIQDKNCLGLSNTALTVDSLPENWRSIPDDLIAFDWALFSLILAEGISATFTDKTLTYYRQHSANVAGTRDLSQDDLRRGFRIKMRHYEFMSRFHEDYSDLYDRMALIKENYMRNPLPKTTQHEAAFWWEAIPTNMERSRT